MIFGSVQFRLLAILRFPPLQQIAETGTDQYSTDYPLRDGQWALIRIMADDEQIEEEYRHAGNDKRHRKQQAFAKTLHMYSPLVAVFCAEPSYRRRRSWQAAFEERRRQWHVQNKTAADARLTSTDEAKGVDFVDY